MQRAFQKAWPGLVEEPPRHSPLPRPREKCGRDSAPRWDAVRFTGKIKRSVRTPIDCKPQVLWKKKKKFNIIVDFPTLKLKNTGYMFLDVFGEKKEDKLKKHIQTLHLKCSQAIHDANQKDLTVFFF